jgi:hypothetical protein
MTEDSSHSKTVARNLSLWPDPTLKTRTSFRLWFSRMRHINLTEMSAAGLPWGVMATGAWGWQPCHLHVPTV